MGHKTSYVEILRSSAVIGGTSVINIGIGILRAKAMAVLLGPAGIGLMGVLMAIFDVATTVAGMGTGSSAVRQIAEAVGSGDTQRIARIVKVLRRTVLVLGVLGAALLLALAVQVSVLSFGTEAYAGAIALLSLAVLFRLIAEGQSGLIQGMRRIGDLAKMSVIGTLVGSIVTVAMVYVFREEGIALALVGGAGVGVVISWSYARRIRTEPVVLRWRETRDETAALLKLGFAFMLSGVMMFGTAFLVRTMVARQLGLEAAGLYQAAWTLGAMYVTIILSAMNKDYYPRLAGVATDRVSSNRMVNEQARVSMLLAGPGILATLTFSPLIISAFYSSHFEPAAEILRWICLGTTLQVIMVPVGYIVLVKNAQKYFIATELAWSVAHVALAGLFLDRFGLGGSGMAFFGAYLLHGLLVYPIVRYLNGFGWSSENRRTGYVLVAMVGIVFAGFRLLPPYLATLVGATLTACSAVYSLRALSRLASPGALPVFRGRRSI